MANANTLWAGFVKELQQCASGSRAWVVCSKARASKLGIAHSNLTIAAASLGLVVARHGCYGFCATRK